MFLRSKNPVKILVKDLTVEGGRSLEEYLLKCVKFHVVRDLISLTNTVQINDVSTSKVE